MTDYKQLCAELLQAWDNAPTPSDFIDTEGYGFFAKIRADLAEPEPDGLPVWTEGIYGDGAVFLKDGVMVPIEEVVRELNRGAQARAALAEPEPERPTDEELVETVKQSMEDCIFLSELLYYNREPLMQILRAVLARWGK